MVSIYLTADVTALMSTFIVSLSIKFFKDRDGLVAYQTRGSIMILNKQIAVTPAIIKNIVFNISFELFILRHFND